VALAVDLALASARLPGAHLEHSSAVRRLARLADARLEHPSVDPAATRQDLANMQTGGVQMSPDGAW
jgi:hypothetical protein